MRIAPEGRPFIIGAAIIGVIFVLLGWWGTLERHQLYYVVFSVWAAQFVASPIWLSHFHFGPVEWLWRALTYGVRPAFRKQGPGGSHGATPAVA